MRNIARRVLLFIVLNAAILITISFIINILGIRPYLTKSGLDYFSLMIFCLLWGMIGAFISLALSRVMAKWMMGVQVIDPSRATGQEKELLNLVHKLVRQAGMDSIPEVGIYRSPEANAFATGPTQSRSLIAVSTGLLNNMNTAEVEGVLAHEVSHIVNGDMVTMTLLQGVVNAFVMFFARVIAYAVTRVSSKEREASPFFYTILVILFEVVFMILGSMVIAAFCRFREFRADAGGARLSSREKMVGALRALERMIQVQDASKAVPAFQAFKISSPKRILRFFASHPPLEERIARLETQYE